MTMSQRLAQWTQVSHKRSQKSMNRDMGTKSFICFYCRGKMQKGTGRQFRLIADGPVWEAHTKHPAHPNEIPATEEDTN